MAWESAFFLVTLRCQCATGGETLFEVRTLLGAEPGGEVLYCYAKPLPVGAQGEEEYFATLKQIGPHLLQVDGSHNGLPPKRYKGCGITRALLLHIAAWRATQIRSSRNRPDEGETFSDDAKGMWKSMVKAKSAWYDATEDRYYCPVAQLLLSLPLETTRLTLREFEPSDSTTIKALYADWAVIDYVGTSPFAPRPGETPEIAFRRVRLSGERPVAITGRTGSLIGALSLLRYVDENGAAPPGDFEITIALLEDARGKRIGSEAFSTVLDALRGDPEVRRVITRVAPGREASLHLVKGQHFTKIGERQNLYLNQRDAVFALDMK